MDQGNDIFGHVFQVHMKERLLRDPVHGLIPVDEQSQHGRLIIDLINSREMQRLRRIRQLGLASYAFQGAEHSRFAHSIGAFHLLRLMLDQLGRMYTIDAELAFYASIATLLHDIGHGPFSHLSERVLGRLAAVVVEAGTPLGHAAVLAREHGVPAVVAVAGALRWLAAAERVLVDGDLGTVTILTGLPSGGPHV